MDLNVEVKRHVYETAHYMFEVLLSSLDILDDNNVLVNIFAKDEGEQGEGYSVTLSRRTPENVACRFIASLVVSPQFVIYLDEDDLNESHGDITVIHPGQISLVDKGILLIYENFLIIAEISDSVLDYLNRKNIGGPRQPNATQEFTSGKYDSVTIPDLSDNTNKKPNKSRRVIRHVSYQSLMIKLSDVSRLPIPGDQQALLLQADTFDTYMILDKWKNIVP